MKVKIKKGRASYPELFVAKPFDETKPNENRAYKLDIFISKEDKATLKQLAADSLTVIREQYADKAEAMHKAFKADAKNYPLKDGDTALNKKGEPIAPGYYVLRAKRREADGPPGVFDNRAGPDGKPAKLTADSGRIYAGCFVNASVELWAQKGKYQGLRCTLLGVQFAGDGEAFSGSRPASAEEFESLADDDTADSDDFSDI